MTIENLHRKYTMGLPPVRVLLKKYANMYYTDKLSYLYHAYIFTVIIISSSSSSKN